MWLLVGVRSRSVALAVACCPRTINVKAFGGLGFLIRGSRFWLGKLKTNLGWGLEKLKQILAGVWQIDSSKPTGIDSHWICHAVAGGWVKKLHHRCGIVGILTQNPTTLNFPMPIRWIVISIYHRQERTCTQIKLVLLPQLFRAFSFWSTRRYQKNIFVAWHIMLWAGVILETLLLSQGPLSRLD